MTTITITFENTLDGHQKNIIRQQILDMIWPDDKGLLYGSYGMAIEDKEKRKVQPRVHGFKPGSSS